MIRFRSPVNQPLHPPRGEEPRQGDDFYVTQRFDDPDFFYGDGRAHRATDIGNGRCGYPIVAMAAGRAFRIKDNATALGAPNDALGIRIDHGEGVSTAYWHLASWSVADGVTVAAGQEIGKLGNTGLGQICHCHIEATVNGKRTDPEPLMFGGTWPPIPLEEDVLGNKTVFLTDPYRARIDKGVSIRSDTTLRDETRVSVTAAPLEVTIVGRASGAEYQGSRNWHVFGEDKAGLRCVHSALTERIPELPSVPAIDNKIAGALTAAVGAQQAINVVVSNLEDI